MSTNALAGKLGTNRYDATQLEVAVPVPRYNEEHAIAKVVADLLAGLRAPRAPGEERRRN